MNNDLSFKIFFYYIRVHLLQELREKLTSKINEIGQKEGRERDKKLKELLVRSFPLVRVKQLRPVVMAILKCTNHIEDKYLKVLVIFSLC